MVDIKGQNYLSIEDEKEIKRGIKEISEKI